MARRFVLKSEAYPVARKLSIDYAGALNPQQYAAATAPGGPVLVVAGAGTGKTRTLVYRVAYLVETGTPPEQILLLTFTRRAAREMLARAAALLDGRCERVQGGTFHAYCAGLLRRHAPRIGFPNTFSILDASDAADVLDVLRTAHGFHRSGRRFPRKKTLQALFSTVVNRGQPLEAVLEAQYPQFVACLDELQTLQAAYVAYKKAHALMDYDDLLLRTLELFETDDAVRHRVAAGCRHVLVDEYQDTNRLQAALVRQFASVHGNVMAVGDDAQSIYRFRGADFRNIFAFPEQFPGTRILKLERNYRSTRPILELANHLIGHARRKYDKVLFTDEAGGERPALVPAPDDRFESRFVAQMVLELREQGLPLDRMAVLFRSSHNAYDLEVELNRRNIPYVKYGGLKLSEAAHIKDVLAHLRVVENPQDAVAWNRILQLIEGIGPKTAQDLIDWITSTAGEPFILPDRPFGNRYVTTLKALFELLRTLRHGERTVAEQVELVLDYYAPILRRQYYEDYPKREQDLEHFAGLAEGFPDRAGFLAALALDPIELSALDAGPLADDEAPLILSTIHSAKGLEFDAVFVIHALDGVLPSGYALGDPDALDEELRLLYVAVTRARRYLFLSYPMVQYRRYQGEYLAGPSRFIAEVPERLLEPWSLVEEPAPAQLGPPVDTAAPRASVDDGRRANRPQGPWRTARRRGGRPGFRFDEKWAGPAAHQAAGPYLGDKSGTYPSSWLSHPTSAPRPRTVPASNRCRCASKPWAWRPWTCSPG
ncbi:MAG: DNA helicase [Rhodothermaceae bacterium]|nr:MAG: DNA helicase [Rhodothermaceae bacterium]